MKKRAKKWVLNVVKLAVCGAALWYLSTKVTLDDRVRFANETDRAWTVVEETGTGADRRFQLRDPDSSDTRTVSLAELGSESNNKGKIERGLKTVVASTKWSWMLSAILIFTPVSFILGWRLRVLLSTQDIDISYRDCLLLTFAGNFFNFTLPGTTGGDLYKAYHIAKRTHKRTEGVTIVVLDRVFGLISFLMIAAVTIFAARNTSVIGSFGAYVGYLMLALIVAGFMFFSERVRRILRFDHWLGKLPFSEKLRRIDATAFALRRHRSQSAMSLLITMVSHFFLVTSIYFLARSFGIDPQPDRGAGQLYIAVLISAVVGYLFAAVPISFQGFGLFEAVFLKVLVEGRWCDASAMLVLTLSARLVQILWSMPGIIVPWMGLERPTAESEDELIPGDEIAPAPQ
ncbi:MAG: flippase-like domain-containing protein [Phycisphaerales bacterium]|nr:flippase-like domain-containing protein [Phycisphaerales bacterium]